MMQGQARCRIAGAILAGGKARRLGGVAKGTLGAACGQPILHRLLREMADAGIEDIIVVANDPEAYGDCGREVIADIHPGLGPLAGIEAAQAALADRAEAILFLPCDAPLITTGEIAALKDAFLAGRDPIVCARTKKTFCHPLCAVVHNDMFTEVSAAIARGRRKVRDLWRRLGAAYVDFDDEAPFLNINHPEELDAWRRRLDDGPVAG